MASTHLHSTLHMSHPITPLMAPLITPQCLLTLGMVLVHGAVVVAEEEAVTVVEANHAATEEV